MTRSIAEWSRLAHELAREKGEHSVVCPHCEGDDHCKMRGEALCHVCNGTGRVEVDHKSPTRIASRLALIHLSISRAVECVVKGEMELRWAAAISMPFVPDEGAASVDWIPAGWKPQGFPIALADVFIRLCDLAESLRVEIKEPRNPCGLTPCETPEEIMCDLAKLHAEVADCDVFGRGFHPDLQRSAWFCRVYRRLAAITYELGIDLFAMAELKYAYEKGRAK